MMNGEINFFRLVIRTLAKRGSHLPVLWFQTLCRTEALGAFLVDNLVHMSNAGQRFKESCRAKLSKNTGTAILSTLTIALVSSYPNSDFKTAVPSMDMHKGRDKNERLLCLLDPTATLRYRAFYVSSLSCLSFLSLLNTVPLHSLKYNSQRLNRRNRG